MKIVHVCETLKGGIESYLSEIVPFQVAHYGASNVQVIIPCDEPEGRKSFFDAVVWPFEKKQRTFSALVKMCWIIVKVTRAEMPDVIHLHSSFAGAIGRIVLAVLSRNAKVVYCPHGWSFQRLGKTKTNWLWEKIEAALATICDKIVCISEHEYKSAIAAGLPSSKLELIVSGISDFSNGIDPKDIRSTEKKSIRLLYVGRLDYQKGIDLLFRALALANRSDIELTIVGEPVINSTWWEEARLTMPGNVNIFGWQERSTLQLFYDHADALVIPSRWEGFGLVAIEALRSGTPVICNTAGALPEIIEDGVSGFHMPFEDEIATKLFFSQLTLDSLAEMRAGARDRYAKVYKSQSMNERTMEMYQKTKLSESVAARDIFFGS